MRSTRHVRRAKNESLYDVHPEYGEVRIITEGQELLDLAKEICDAFGEEGLYVDCEVALSCAQIDVYCTYSDGIDSSQIACIYSIGDNKWMLENTLNGKEFKLLHFPDGDEIFSRYDVDLMERFGFYSTAEESRKFVSRRKYSRI